jgi:hypothetical protein
VAWLSSNITPSTPLPLHTFYTKTTAFRAWRKCLSTKLL